MNDGLVLERKRQVLARTGLSQSSLYEAMGKTGPDAFPRPVKIAAKAVAWVSTEVDAWIASRPRTGNQEAA